MKIKSTVVAACLSACAMGAMAGVSVGTVGSAALPFTGTYSAPIEPGHFSSSIVFTQVTPQALSATFYAVGGPVVLDQQAYVEPNVRISFPERPVDPGPTFPTIFATPVLMADGGYRVDLGVVPAGEIILGFRGTVGAGVTGFTGLLGPTAAVPEASALATMSLGLVGLAGLAVRNKRHAQARPQA